MAVRATGLALAGAGVTCALLFVALNAVSSRLATDRAIERARRFGELDARAVLDPYMTNEVLHGASEAMHELDQVTRRYLAASGAVRVKVWTADGLIAFSDEHRLIGQRFELDDDDRKALVSGSSLATVSDLSKPENEFERSQRRLLEVYVGGATESGDPILIETYYPYAMVAEAAHEIRTHYIPVLVAAIGLLALVQVPVSVGFSLRLQRSRRARSQLLERLLNVSDAERRRVAGEVHDGAVQDLIGLGYALGGVAERAPADQAERLSELSRELGGVVSRLRELLTSIYPTVRTDGGIESGIHAMVSGLGKKGIDVHVDVDPAIALSDVDKAVFLRAVGELARNIEHHSEANTVSIRLVQHRDHIMLEVVDDGIGFSEPSVDAKPRAGHFGLRLLTDLANDSGGSLAIAAAPGQGTRATLQLPREP